MTSDLVTETMLIALKHHQRPEYLYSDMGSQYTSQSFEKLLQIYQIKHSYSLKGPPYDNSSIEAFHSLLKREFVLLSRFTSYDNIVLRTSNYIH